ncbi:MAG: hypothetical protein MZV64_26250 [Ignavibacteriales bacterium]|nr:hypothetical protein [Ignavibacteriales bacterium]
MARSGRRNNQWQHGTQDDVITKISKLYGTAVPGGSGPDIIWDKLQCSSFGLQSWFTAFRSAVTYTASQFK